MQPKIEAKVRAALDVELEEGVNMIKKELHLKVQEDR